MPILDKPIEDLTFAELLNQYVNVVIEMREASRAEIKPMFQEIMDGYHKRFKELNAELEKRTSRL